MYMVIGQLQKPESENRRIANFTNIRKSKNQCILYLIALTTIAINCHMFFTWFYMVANRTAK